MKIFLESGSNIVKPIDGNLGWDIVYNSNLGYKILNNSATLRNEKQSKECFGDIELEPKERIIVRTGVRIEFPKGYGGLLKERSSLAKQGMLITGGVIDETYIGEIQVLITNVSNQIIEIKNGDRFAQLVFVPVVSFDYELVATPEELRQTERGEGGFGSTGK